MRGSLVNFPPKFHCDQGGAQKRRLAFKRHRIEHILPPRALMTLIIGAPCSLQPRLSDHLWVHLSNSCQNPGVAGGVPENGEFTIKHHRIENILPPRAPMAQIFGVPCSSEPGLFGYTGVYMANTHQKVGVVWRMCENGDLDLIRDGDVLPPRARLALIQCRIL